MMLSVVMAVLLLGWMVCVAMAVVGACETRLEEGASVLFVGASDEALDCDEGDVGLNGVVVGRASQVDWAVGNGPGDELWQVAFPSGWIDGFWSEELLLRDEARVCAWVRRL